MLFLLLIGLFYKKNLELSIGANHSANHNVVIKRYIMDANISIVCFKSKILANGEHPLILRISQGKLRYFKSLGISVKPSLWNFDKEEPKRNCPNREQLLNIMNLTRQKYVDMMFELKVLGKDFTPQSLAESVEKNTNKQNVGTYIQHIVQYMTAEKRLGNAKAYTSCYNSLLKFAGNLDIPFTDIDVNWLKRYELCLRERGNSDNTIGIRMRELRAVYNKAIEDNVVNEKYYPFTKFKISHYCKGKCKRAITKSEINKIINVDLSEITTYCSPLLYLSKDLFTFSYLCCDMNMIDIAYLKYSDIINGRVCFIRHKTRQPITFQLLPQAMQIIDKYRKDGVQQSDYVFPILDRKFHRTEQQQYDRIRKVIKGMNKSLKKIGTHLNISIPLTTYVARHSFATVLKRSGVNIALISEAMGHTSLSTTQLYLDSFENEQVDEAMKNLL